MQPPAHDAAEPHRTMWNVFDRFAAWALAVLETEDPTQVSAAAAGEVRKWLEANNCTIDAKAALAKMAKGKVYDAVALPFPSSADTPALPSGPLGAPHAVTAPGE